MCSDRSNNLAVISEIIDWLGSSIISSRPHPLRPLHKILIIQVKFVKRGYLIYMAEEQVKNDLEKLPSKE